MRAPCGCGSTWGRITVANGQNVVRCFSCDRFQYNAPKAETGQRLLHAS